MKKEQTNSQEEILIIYTNINLSLCLRLGPHPHHSKKPMLTTYEGFSKTLRFSTKKLLFQTLWCQVQLCSTLHLPLGADQRGPDN